MGDMVQQIIATGLRMVDLPHPDCQRCRNWRDWLNTRPWLNALLRRSN